MLRRDTKIKSTLHPTHMLLLALVLAGCSSVIGMTEVDKYWQERGYTLHCTEVAGEECLTRQWVNEGLNSYRRYHGPNTNGTNSTNN